jgi:hypothetical protein
MSSIATIPVDFSNRDEDGAVRLVTRGTLDYCRKHGLVFSEEMAVVMSDGELKAEAGLSQRDGMWVAQILKWLD